MAFGTDKSVLCIEVSLTPGVLIKSFHCIYSEERETVVATAFSTYSCIYIFIYGSMYQHVQKQSTTYVAVTDVRVCIYSIYALCTVYPRQLFILIANVYCWV